jgi:hypothetical protein
MSLLQPKAWSSAENGIVKSTVCGEQGKVLNLMICVVEVGREMIENPVEDPANPNS